VFDFILAALWGLDQLLPLTEIQLEVSTANWLALAVILLNLSIFVFTLHYLRRHRGADNIR
jgi:uncharacterized membrane protein